MVKNMPVLLSKDLGQKSSLRLSIYGRFGFCPVWYDLLKNISGFFSAQAGMNFSDLRHGYAGFICDFNRTAQSRCS